MGGTLLLHQPGEVPYQTAWDWQKQRLQVMQAGLDGERLPAGLFQPSNTQTLGSSARDGLLLLSHPPVYTLGQGGDEDFLRFDRATAGYEVHRVERGGEVTYHGPGQWVGYPLLDLRRHRQDLHWYLRQLEQISIEVLEAFGLVGERIEGLTGVWCQGAKVSAIGIRATRWITWHGFSLNVCPDMEDFARIVPCGIGDRPVGSLNQFIPGISMEEVAPEIIRAFCKVFPLDPQTVDLETWLSSP